VSNAISCLIEGAARGSCGRFRQFDRARDKSAARVAGNRHDRVSPSESILAKYSCEATSRLRVTALRCSQVRMFHRSSITVVARGAERRCTIVRTLSISNLHASRHDLKMHGAGC
jgi:hypothetical protein